MDQAQYFLHEFAEQRRETREKLAQLAKEESKRISLAGALQIDDENLLQRIRALGFDGDTGRIFDILPLIHIAWADGRVQPAEQRMILDILTHRGIQPTDEAWLFVAALLEQPPAQEYMELILRLLRDVLQYNGQNPDTIVDLCLQVASAAGGFLRLTSPVSDDERKALENVAQTLTLDQNKSIQSLLG